MLSMVEEHVDQPQANLFGGDQCPGVIPVRPHRAPTMRGSVERPRAPHSEALHASNQRQTRVRLDDEVQVIALN